MLHYLILLLLLFPQDQTAPAQTDEVGPEPPPPTYDQGPMKATLLAMRDVRFFYGEQPERAERESNFAMQFRVEGEKLGGISSYGNFILDVALTDTGESLVDAESISEEDRTFTRPNNIPIERLRTTGLTLVARCKSPPRQAQKLTSMKGSVRLVLASDTESVTIDNPFQYLNATVQHPRLNELGIEVRILKADTLEPAPPANRSVVLQLKANAAKVQSATFVDGWMRPVQSRESKAKTTGGEDCVVHTLDPQAINDDLQLVLEIHPEVEELLVKFEESDVTLP